MTIRKFLRRWASGGILAEPSTPKQDLGWVDNEQVPFEWANWLQDRLEDKIDRIVQERIDSFFEASTDPHKAISTGLWPDSWGVGNDAANVISGGSSKAYHDLEVYFTEDGSPRLLVYDSAANVIEVWDPRSLLQVGGSADLTLDLPSGGGETWFALRTDRRERMAPRSSRGSPPFDLVEHLRPLVHGKPRSRGDGPRCSPLRRRGRAGVRTLPARSIEGGFQSASV